MVRDQQEPGILGIMSGTSLDGLDLAFCRFSQKNNTFGFKLLKAETLAYPVAMANRLNDAINLSARDLCILDHEYGKWIGKAAKEFLDTNKLEADYIASHGHTVFHQPSDSFTLQIGNGNDIAAITGIRVIFDFRSRDVALGGQGAPLVPAGDEYLFQKYDYCMNLGGFSNISFRKEGKRLAFDICPVNMGLNYLANQMGMSYDIMGRKGREGKIIPELLDKLDRLEFYHTQPPKSLGREWYLENMEPILKLEYSKKDILRSLYEHIATQVSKVLNENQGQDVLITGGGAKNKFLVELIAQKTKCECIIPDTMLVDFKEALIFAFLGFLRINNLPNVFSSVTGALADHCAGIIAEGN